MLLVLLVLLLLLCICLLCTQLQLLEQIGAQLIHLTKQSMTEPACTYAKTPQAICASAKASWCA